jgi:hypothetical protein
VQRSRRGGPPFSGELIFGLTLLITLNRLAVYESPQPELAVETAGSVNWASVHTWLRLTPLSHLLTEGFHFRRTRRSLRTPWLRDSRSCWLSCGRRIGRKKEEMCL